MDKEPNELVTARASLRKSEENFGDSEKLPYLKSGINSLADVILGNSAQVHKDLTTKLVATYRSRVLLEVEVILSNADSYDMDSLEHWNNVMDVFTDAGFDDDPNFKACQKQLFTKWGIRLLGSLKPWELEILKSEVQKKTIPDNKC